MLTLVFILIIIACVLLTLVVLIQNPKGGGIAANFVAPTQIMGAKRTSDVVEKATWVLALALIVLTLGSNFFRPSNEEVSTQDSRLKDAIETTTVPAAPSAPQQQKEASPVTDSAK
ncbi:MAG: preprotein translocase subunit SecG [Bacteroidetes bacterium]|nr:preprotein translocase subunit SecG [Bacteroidota bacterium]